MQLMAPLSLRWQSPLKHSLPTAVAACVLANFLVANFLVANFLVANFLVANFLVAGFLVTPTLAAAGTNPARVAADAAENEYANVIAQIGGPYVSVTAIMSNPNTDPHEFEASASVAEEVSQAQLIVQNGVGYDTFMNKIESASHRSGRQVIVAQD